MIKFIIILCIFLMVGLAIMGVLVVVSGKKTSGNSNVDEADGELNNPNIGSVGDSKDFFPVEEFCDYALDLGNQDYRAIIEVGSINYGLLSPQEQQITDMAYKGMLNSLTSPIEVYVQTTEFNKVQMQEILHENIQESVDMFPSVSEYALEYEENMKYLTDYLGNSKIKKKYVIIPYSSADFTDVSSLSLSEIRDFALEELNTRVSVVANGLAACNLSVKLLDKRELAEVLYAYYHRSYSHIAQDILKGEFSDIVLSSKNPYNEKLRLDGILADAENRIRTCLVGAGSSEEEKLYKYIIEILGDLRQDTKQRDLKGLLDLAREMAAEERYKTYGTRQVGEPTGEDYLTAFGLSGSGVKKEDIAGYVQETYSKAPESDLYSDASYDGLSEEELIQRVQEEIDAKAGDNAGMRLEFDGDEEEM